MENPVTQRRGNLDNQPKIFFFLQSQKEKTRTPNMINKALRNLHINLGHDSYADDLRVYQVKGHDQKGSFKD